MYRVELKVKVRGTIILDKEVPNVPCGVERKFCNVAWVLLHGSS